MKNINKFSLFIYLCHSQGILFLALPTTNNKLITKVISMQCVNNTLRYEINNNSMVNK